MGKPAVTRSAQLTESLRAGAGRTSSSVQVSLAGTSAGTPAMIFIVDDDDSVRTSLTRLLRSVGYAARPFADAPAFLHDLDAAGAAARCVILDVHMPGMAGPELLAAINRGRPLVPVIILTATDDADLRGMAVAAGVTRVLRKPCDATALFRAVADA